jgi:hypothetical protein
LRLGEDQNKVGARCPRCREPLYQRKGRFPRDAEEGEAECSVHPGSVSIGICARCGNFLCETCRTPWDDRIQCAGCVDRAIQSGDLASGAKRSHSRQAAFGLAGGILAWLLTAALGVIAWLVVRGQGGGNTEAGVAALLGLLMLVVISLAVSVALLGIGFSTAALRVRGDSMIVATLGLLLNGLHIGALVGIFLFSIWVH